ncbi:ABC transporter substrate-binding protein [Jiangella gansuensis]|uniref:ABC transporter substrate-binding protein n=1 Tax=Jiangella gansuensis TaxID=281473 RepID=UPI0004B58E6C|nr:ABC transporter substrate-binding protein [Jiangella gansuensis]
MKDTPEGADGAAGTSITPLTRRAVLRAAGLGAGVLTLGTGLLSACSGDDRSASSTPGTDGSPPRGGRFTAAFRRGFSNLETSTIPGAAAIAISWYWSERLYRPDPLPPRSELFPELATAMPEELSPTTYRIPLRADVTFHDGAPLTAEDVVFTVEWVRDPANGSLWAPFLDIIENIGAINDTELEVTLQAPTTLLAARLALFPIRSRAAQEPFELEPIGSGPYRVVSAASDERVVLERFEGYAGSRDIEYDELELVVVSDDNARISGLRAGQFKLVEDVPPSAFEQLSGADDVKVEAVDGYGWTTAIFNCGRSPFDNANLRRAVAYAIDRDAINQTRFLGLAAPAWTGFVSPDHPDYTEPDVVYRFDPAHARGLIEDAGFDVDAGVPIDLLVSGAPADAPIIEQNLRDVGFAPRIIPIDDASSLQTSGEFDLSITAGITDTSFFSTGLEFMTRFSFTGFVVDSLAHWSGSEREEVERILNESVAAADEDAYRAALADALNIIQDEVPILAIMRPKQITGWSNTLEDFRPGPSIGVVVDGVRG